VERRQPEGRPVLVPAPQREVATEAARPRLAAAEQRAQLQALVLARVLAARQALAQRREPEPEPEPEPELPGKQPWAQALELARM
jgi:hypothetical protein